MPIKPTVEATPEPTPTPAPVRATRPIVQYELLPSEQRTMVFVVERIEFDFDKATLRPDSVQMLTELGASLARHPEAWDSLTIEGHTDNVGNAASNQTLSEVVDKVDCFYRHLRGLLSALDFLNSMDIAFVSVQERLDFTTVWGKLTLTVLGTLAEIYIDNLRQETRKGKLQRARDGLWNGNISYGYCKGLCSNCKEPNGAGYCPDFGQPDKSDGKHLILHPIDSKVVRLIYDWYLSDLESDGHIALRLLDHAITEDGLRARSRGLPGQKAGGPLQKESVRGILTNIFYARMVPYYGMVQRGLPTTRRVKEAFPGKHPSIITKKEYDRVQEKRRTLGSTPLFHQPTQSRIYPLAGLLRCGYCGRLMRGSSGKDHYYYRDTTRIEKSGNCPQCTVRADAVEDQMIAWLNTIFQNRLLDETSRSDDQQPIKIEERYNRGERIVYFRSDRKGSL